MSKVSEIRSAFSVLDDLFDLENSTNKKIEHLKRNKNNRYLREALKWTYDPYTTYGIVDNNEYGLREKYHGYGIVGSWKNFNELISDLKVRNITGNQARDKTSEVISGSSPLLRPWLQRIINRDLEVGINVTTINKVFPNLIDDFSLAKANLWDGNSRIEFPVFVEPKIDGMRICIVIRNGIGQALSYNGKDYTDVFGPWIEAFESISKNIVYDGEAYADGGWNETISLVRRSVNIDKKAINRKLRLILFDSPTLNALSAKHDYADHRSFDVRRKLLEYDVNYVKSNYPKLNVEVIKQWDANSKRDIIKLYDKSLNMGFEGIMIKDPSAPYINDRTDNWLKFKPEHTVDGTIIDSYLGTGRNSNRLGGFDVELDDGTVVKVGGGFTDSQRDVFWKKRKSMKGMKIEIKSQTQIGNKVASIRFPVFSRLREDL